MTTPMEPVELVAGDLLLRPWRESDRDAYWAALEAPGGRVWWGEGLDSPDDVATMLERRRDDWSRGDRASWCVSGAAGNLLGSVALYDVDPVQRGADLTYWIAPHARGRGIAVRAVESALRWAFADLAVLRVQLFHAVENTASRRVAEKARFTLEGRLRSSHRYGDGRWHDELLWARLAEDPPPSP